MNEKSIADTATAICSTYDWCDGDHGVTPEPWEGTILHHARNDVETKLWLGVGTSTSRVPEMYAVHESEGGRHTLYVDLSEATVDLPYSDVPRYLTELRGFADRLETYYRLTANDAAEISA